MPTMRVALQSGNGHWHAPMELPAGVLPDYIVWNRSVYAVNPSLEPPQGYNGPVYVQVFAWWAPTERG